jgi:MFS family permease
MERTGGSSGERSLLRLPASIWALGLVSLFMDVSSEMIHGLLPVFLVSVLGASVTTVGLIEGVGEATASISKLFSGWISDRLGKRKALTVIGYGVAALSKPLFAIARSSSWVLAARFSDRIGKGIRGAPRDALLGDLTPPGLTGAAFGLRQALDTVGAFAGPLLAIALMSLFHGDYRRVFWWALVPALVSVAILVLAVREPAPGAPREARGPIRWTDTCRLGGGRYWIIVAVGAVLTLARFSEAFLILRAQKAGLAAGLAPLVLVAMNIIYAGSAYPLGALSDRVDRRLILAAGFLVLIIADLVLAFAPGVTLVMVGVGLWGLHLGMTQGLLAALVADSAPSALRASAFGMFNFVSGVALLLASLLAGLLWQAVGPYATFICGAALTALGLIGTVTFMRPSAAAPASG